MNKESNNQSFRSFVQDLKGLNKEIEVKLEGEIQEIIANPLQWAEDQAEKHIMDNVGRIIKARKLGDRFFENISKG